MAKRHGKLITVLLDPLTPDQFPMGLYSQQAIDLTGWKGDFDDAEWRKLNRDIEAKLTPPWMQRRVFELEAELVAERTRREGTGNRHHVLQAQIAKEVMAQDDLRRERDEVVDQMAALRTTAETLRREHDQAVDASATLKRTVGALEGERSEFQEYVADLTQRLRAAEAQGQLVQPSRSVGGWAIYVVSIGAALVIGFETYLLIGRTPPSVSQPFAQNSTVRFTIRINTVAEGPSMENPFAQSLGECEQYCRNRRDCTAFAYQKTTQQCFLLRTLQEFRSHQDFDSGSRN